METVTTVSQNLTAKRADMFKVPTSKLRVKEGMNIRTDYGDIQELAESARVHGIIVPMRGYREKDTAGEEVFIITDGHRRNAACQLLLQEGIEILVPFILENKGYNDEQRVIDMFIMNEGKALTPLEQATGVQRLINYGYTEKEIAQKLAKSEIYVKKLNSLNSAPKKFLNLITDGIISATLAMQVIYEGKVEEVLEKVAAGKTLVAATDDSAEMKQGTDGSAITEPKAADPEQKEKKITAKDLKGNDSVKAFKKFARNQDEELLSEETLYIFQFANKLVNNELSEEDIKEFFK